MVPGGVEPERLKLKALNDDLYQHVWEGKCRSIAGLLFKRHWFKRYDLGQHPEGLNMYLSGDYAGGPDPDNPDSEPDWTEFGAFGIDKNTDIWALDWWSGQEDPAVWIQAWLGMVKRHRPTYYFEEKGADPAGRAWRDGACHARVWHLHDPYAAGVRK